MRGRGICFHFFAFIFLFLDERRHNIFPHTTNHMVSVRHIVEEVLERELLLAI